MRKKKTELVAWVKAHRKQLLIAGISITAILGVIIGLKNKDAILDMCNSLEDSVARVPEQLPKPMSVAQVTPAALEEVISVRSYTSPREAFDVSQHIRNLSGGRCHSAEKAAEAATLGIFLLPSQTLVDKYTKCSA